MVNPSKPYTMLLNMQGIKEGIEETFSFYLWNIFCTWIWFESKETVTFRRVNFVSRKKIEQFEETRHFAWNEKAKVRDSLKTMIFPLIWRFFVARIPWRNLGRFWRDFFKLFLPSSVENVSGYYVCYCRHMKKSNIFFITYEFFYFKNIRLSNVNWNESIELIFQVIN